MKAKDCPMTKALCQLVDQAVTDAKKEVISECEVHSKKGKATRVKKGYAIDLGSMGKLKEAQRWCEETEIFGT